MKRIFFIGVFVVLSFFFVGSVSAQTPTPEETATESANASVSATPVPLLDTDITKPESEDDRQGIRELFKQRPIDTVTPTNLIAYSVRYAVEVGVPANTIILILLMPFLATIVVFFRYIVGLSGLGILVPTALSITLLSTGLIAGFILLATILVASFIARLILKRIRIMQLPKLALSMWFISIAIIITLTISSAAGLLSVRDISIFPILLFVLLSDRVVALFLERSMKEVIIVTLVTLLLGIIGFFLFSWESLRVFVLLYPEIVLLFVPLNIVMGRYFGLRVTEYIRFNPIREYGSH